MIDSHSNTLTQALDVFYSGENTLRLYGNVLLHLITCILSSHLRIHLNQGGGLDLRALFKSQNWPAEP